MSNDLTLQHESGIIEPGIYSHITNNEYHSSPGISKSGVCELLKSPAHYYSRYLDPERVRSQETEAMKIGSAAHKIILEPDSFFVEFDVLPDAVAALNKNTKEYKAYVSATRERGKTPLSPDDFKKIEKMAGSVRLHPSAGLLTTGGKAEQSMYWIDPDTGVLCKCRPDYWIPGLALPDIKTTADARQDEFAKSCARYDYHIQAAFYSDGVRVLTGESLPMPFIAVEKDSPFAIGVYNIDDPYLSKAQSDYKRALETFARCLEACIWPSYPPEVITISLPGWKK